ncbi:ComEC/Rec2 family competence protein [Blastochloris viridis]|uniref:ComEC family competence protein n=1 Tax=Blastochloris viridis TaxID=1079 RepID=A0A0H5BHM0_BLAVI|nr:ComEC/Rec2 family competence protein [Blastochloris viridis]ALK10187.1 ComEC family competence protein [Blastochloris viridis]BAR99881.1 DNA internalization-related competence protein ComEC/Rec2 [Blastochloris viridis]CUU42851.1 ComEC family competence protein [Blastochloris viridis]
MAGLSGRTKVRAAVIGRARTLAGAAPLPTAGLSRLAALLAAWWHQERAAARGPLWLPVVFAAGVLTYFQAEREPSLIAAALVMLALAAIAVVARARPLGFPLAVALAVFAAGFTAATLRTASVAHPVLARPTVATVSGFVADRDQREKSDRVILHVTATAPALDPQPTRLRIVVRPNAAPPVGSHIAVRARLNPPAGPVRPGAWDFGRDLWFAGISGTGLAMGEVRSVPPIGAMPWPIALRQAVEGAREGLGQRIRTIVPGDAGAIAVALVTGERDAIAESTNDSLRVSGLYHIISISGLHMVAVVATVLVVVRGTLALVPGMAVRRPIKQWAASAAIAAAAAYWLLSGAEVATTRAFLMAGLVLAGVLIGRAALSLRTLAAAALAVMIAMPESVLNPGFQMSFSATLALIAFYERWAPSRRFADGDAVQRVVRGLGLATVGLALAALVAGLATAPFAAAHFHRLSPYSLLANLMATPLVSGVVMPAGVGAVLLLPFGFDRPLWLLMGWGVARTLDVSTFVAGLPGADARLAAFGDGPLLLAVTALLVGLLPVSPLRLAALPVAALALAVALGAPSRPDVLVEAGGRMVAVRGPDGRLSILNAGADRFAARIWLAADGDRRAPNDPGLAAGFACDREGCIARLEDGAAVAVPTTLAALEEDCAKAAVVVTRASVAMACAAVRIDPARLYETGALALGRTAAGWRFEPARDSARERPWAVRADPAASPSPHRQPASSAAVAAPAAVATEEAEPSDAAELSAEGPAQ